MKSSSVLALLALVAGCAASVHETYAPDGRKAFTLNCGGFGRGWDKCMAKAGELCQAAGYDIFERDSETGSYAMMTNGNFAAGTRHDRTMLVACKAPPP